MFKGIEKKGEYMQNNFFSESSSESEIRNRYLALERGSIGFYSIGLYPASLAYNC